MYFVCVQSAGADEESPREGCGGSAAGGQVQGLEKVEGSCKSAILSQFVCAGRILHIVSSLSIMHMMHDKGRQICVAVCDIGSSLSSEFAVCECHCSYKHCKMSGDC